MTSTNKHKKAIGREKNIEECREEKVDKRYAVSVKTGVASVKEGRERLACEWRTSNLRTS